MPIFPVGIRKYIKKLYKKTNIFNPLKLKREIDTLYELLYKLTHDMENAVDLAAFQVQEVFANQWENLKEGKYLLSDPWFKENVSRILYEEEIQIKPEWFKGKNVLDVGCGNGRWAYGFAELGANITAVDINQIAIDETKKVIDSFDIKKEFYISPVESLSQNLPSKKYELVFSWGVLHHCESFYKSLNEIVKFVSPKGILYLYLYGRESLSYSDDIELFKERIRYNSLPTEKDKYKFLLRKANNDSSRIHNYHDIYAPLINRRFKFTQIEQILKSKGFEDITRTINHSELFIRAIRNEASGYYKDWLLPKKQPPYWFQHHRTT